MFVILWLFAQKPRPVGAVCGLFVLLYGVFRFIVEFVREPDAPSIDWLTRGQLLTIPMIIVGIATIWLAYNKFGMADK